MERLQKELKEIQKRTKEILAELDENDEKFKGQVKEKKKKKWPK